MGLFGKMFSKKNKEEVVENVNTEVLQKVCIALNCDVGDIMEMIPQEDDE